MLRYPELESFTDITAKYLGRLFRIFCLDAPFPLVVPHEHKLLFNVLISQNIQLHMYTFCYNDKKTRFYESKNYLCTFFNVMRSYAFDGNALHYPC